MKYLTKKQTYRYWTLNKDIIEQPYEDWMEAMLDMGIYIMRDKGYVTYED